MMKQLVTVIIFKKQLEGVTIMIVGQRFNRQQTLLIIIKMPMDLILSGVITFLNGMNSRLHKEKCFFFVII